MTITFILTLLFKVTKYLLFINFFRITKALKLDGAKANGGGPYKFLSKNLNLSYNFIILELKISFFIIS